MTTPRQLALQKISSGNRQSCQSYYEKGKAVWNRLLNGFPNLISDEKLLEFTFQFQKLLKEIELIQKPDAIAELTASKDKSRVNEWGAEVVAEACKFLLDKQTIQLDVMKAIGLEEKVDPTKPELVHAMVSSLVGNIILEQVMAPLEKMIFNHQHVYNAICMHINANYAHWVNQELKRYGVEIKPEHMIREPFYFRLLAEPKKAITFAAVLTGALAIGVALFKALESKSEYKRENSQSNKHTM